ncbi:hypothetical protein [Pantoea stewartii]|uniref:hypothetical protein n=1 Tax=Pantoea stewartii TaxID=66269 RepID=UPI0016279823|nr:hypothetical protein [Pantoea stewartii]MBC0852580.1 hypothetical protein [Pantoea stewartii]
MASVSQLKIRPAGGGNSSVEVNYDDGSNVAFNCPEAAARVMTDLVTALNLSRRSQQATTDAYRRGKNTSFATRDSELPPNKLDAKTMALIRRVVPGFDEWELGSDSRMASLDALRLAPAEAISTVCSRPLDSLSLADAVGVLEAVADYMEANGIDPLPLQGANSARHVSEINEKFWKKEG